ncbi:MAG TPA: tRNA (N6-threonylcarbamoyladenosine(37)-N6)-methyltransferase TrmO [Anaerohalosphaeraceae bacterium]|nr:tRNA (N6-threonylcarbamoyladenosine(37)-N6)-methyltransferase TrmO [Anaerohalosphaeraceae bacterium]
MHLKAIGIIHTPFCQADGTPIQSAAARQARGRLEIFPEYAEGLSDLEGFERIWLLYWFDRAAAPQMKVVPFLDTGPRGLFATRAPCRPNPIGMSCVKLLKIENNLIEIEDVDILDNTPLLDIKPYVPAFDVFDVRKIGWLQNKKPENRQADQRFWRKEF